MKRLLVAGAALAAVLAACGTTSKAPSSQTGEDAGDVDADMPPDMDATAPPVDAAMPVDAPPPVDAAEPPWNPKPLTCPSPGNYTKNGVGCGQDRWAIKTGTDSGATKISLTPTLVREPMLVSLPTPATLPQSSRIAPTENTLYALRDARIQLIRLESDSDYHLVVAQDGYTLIAEVPYPGCVDPPSPWQCLVSRARAAIDAKYTVDMNGIDPNVVATIVGVGFFDDEHGQTGAAGNNVELHPVLAICFGVGCDPFK